MGLRRESKRKSKKKTSKNKKEVQEETRDYVPYPIRCQCAGKVPDVLSPTVLGYTASSTLLIEEAPLKIPDQSDYIKNEPTPSPTLE